MNHSIDVQLTLAPSDQIDKQKKMVPIAKSQSRSCMTAMMECSCGIPVG